MRGVDWRWLASTVLIVGAATRAESAAEDWPQWRGPRVDGVSTETQWRHDWPAAGPKQAWKTDVGIGYSSVVIRDKFLVTMGNRDDRETVYCLNTDTGEPLWKFSYDCPLDPNLFEGGPTSTPTIDGDDVVTLSRRGHVFCFALATGKVKWQVNALEAADVRLPGWGFAGAPVVWNELVILNVGEAGLALNRRDGSIAWKSADREAGYATPLLVSDQGKMVAVIASSRAMIGVDASSGEQLWRHRWVTRYGVNAADPVVRDRRLFISSGYNKGSALLDLGRDDPKVGWPKVGWPKVGWPKVVWEGRQMQNQFSSSVLINGKLYGIDGNTHTECRLKCLDFATGETLWSETWPAIGALSAAGNRLIVLDETGRLVIVEASPAGYRELAKTRAVDGKCWTVPVLANGRIYCRGGEGALVCLDVR